MKKPGKITAIILLSASLGSWFFINKNMNYDRPSTDKSSFIDRPIITALPAPSILLKATIDKENNHSNWSNQQIIERLNHQDSQPGRNQLQLRNIMELWNALSN